MVIALGVNLSYLGYRGLYSLNLTSAYGVFASLVFYLAELYGFVALGLYFFQVWSPVEQEPPPPLEGRSVDVLVTTYNEDLQLLRTTLSACNQMTYPHRTYLLDDGCRPEAEALASELGIGYITREGNHGAKAGNLNNALRQTEGEFVAIFDADHVPEPNFLTRLVGYFRDEKMAVVQTPHSFYNLDSFQFRVDFERRKKWDEQEVFFRLIQPGKNRWNAAFFAGSAALFRRKIGYTRN